MIRVLQICKMGDFIMATTKDEKNSKISETRFVIFIPLLVTAICAWFDFLLSGQEHDLINILKMVYTYFFPSIAATMFTLIIQKTIYHNDSCGIANGRGFLSSILLAIYAVSFISCLYQYNLCTLVVFGVFSLVYLMLTWLFCLDREITHNIKDPVAIERNALKRVINKNKEMGNNAK